MKCDELKVETIVPQGSAITLQMYGKAEVDEAIADLKARIRELESMPHTDNSAVIDALETENEALKKELAELRDAYRWRDVTEELPEDETVVPVILSNDWRTTDYYEKDKGKWHYHWDNVAYWFKIPKA